MPIGPLELVLILIIALLIFGGRRIPDAGRALGGGIRSLIDGVRGIHEEEETAEPVKVSSEPEKLPPPS